jgi:hypothetical protein
MPLDALLNQLGFFTAADYAAIVVPLPDGVEIFPEGIPFSVRPSRLLQIATAPGCFRATVWTDDPHLVVFVQFSRHAVPPAMKARLAVFSADIELVNSHLSSLRRRFILRFPADVVGIHGF